MLNTTKLVLSRTNKSRLFSTFPSMPVLILLLLLAPQNYLVVIKDFTDSECLQRRLNTRDEHLKGALINKANNVISLGGATLDNETDGKMDGSYILLEAESIKDIDTMLKADPYYKAKVWEKWEIKPVKM
ncbi:hypothetical protein INT48_009767 [Thamnidium elegans]|uniref:YCII-related domain-containing protein n=1 Tax=Thamnidium elegans TaxID=101142 RepID=A0A8H7SNP9_9FUNG|nr:hypothetical protein INT48_009767 [Thamnidium elegans]